MGRWDSIRFIDRLLAKIQPTEGCWLWTGKTDGGYGYGRILQNGKMVRAHRPVYEAYYGKIPRGLIVRHKCDNPRCVSPWHLELGTQADNVRDRDTRGRHIALRGESNGNSKLDASTVSRILSMKGKANAKAIAAELGVHVTSVYNIWKQKTWKELSNA